MKLSGYSKQQILTPVTVRVTIGSQILIKSETFALKQDLQYPPPGVGGGGHVIIGIWEKKIRIIGI